MEPKGRADKAGTYIIDGWQGYVPALSGMRSGRQEFKITFEDGRHVSSVELEDSAPPPSAATGLGFITMATAAKLLHQSYWSLSRRWKQLGLKPRRVGKRYFFTVEDIRAMIARQCTPALKKGKQRRVVGLI
ncbi:MAG TPA: hypothetical protein DCZ01_03690 [Elusimicrobia bacterium]|nr:MAG: hypothetical protein A2X37_05945 [Elusimicrobia bacterium GWA2_66_18]OGR70622.1 MAG: hypothetical protein A2X40_07625 [Elusimicrobia bacterium GWC2_65_9]HAZ07630.1 hypothetical protein [Elusimicrobiota bacterium]